MSYSETPELQPIVPGYHLSIFSEGQLEELKSATVEVLKLLRRRPCRAVAIADSIGISYKDVIQIVSKLLDKGQIIERTSDRENPQYHMQNRAVVVRPFRLAPRVCPRRFHTS